MATPESESVSPTAPLPDGPAAARRRARQALIRVIAHVAVVAGTLTAVYALAPLGRVPEGRVAVWLGLDLAVVLLILAVQIRSVRRADYPGLRALQAVAISIPVLLLPFAAAYFSTERAVPGSFTESLTKIDALYFTVTVFATVGFGDIAPVSQAMRALTTVQMIVDLVVIGLIAKVLVGVVRERRELLAASRGGGSRGAVGRPD